MEISRLIDALSRPAAYPDAVDRVEVRQTHISVAFLAGPLVYKVKKPVSPGFLDFSTLDKRRHFCQEEVRLNRRLAPDVYLGVVPVVRSPSGVHFEGEGEVVDWAVKMQRLPDAATFRERLGRGEVSPGLAQALGHRLAAFHQSAEASPRGGPYGRYKTVARTIRDIYAQAAPLVGTTVAPAVFERVRGLTEQSLDRLRPLIDGRAERGVTRDCHGDLHLDHVYYFPDRPPPGDLVIIDCIEFNERFRFIDPVADLAFPAMDFTLYGRRDLARAFADAYFDATGDPEGCGLLPLYSAYRATVRGLVEGLLREETEVAASERAAALGRARAYWLVALSELEEPGRKPCVVLVAGLPGTGKSTLARELAKRADFTVIRSDVVRKELAGLPVLGQTPATFRDTLYSRTSTERTYAECLNRAERLVFEGRRVLVDATFREEARRRTFLEAAVRWGVPSTLLVCQADPETARRRLEARPADASDADWSVYRQLAARWEPVQPLPGQAFYPVSTEGSPEQALARGLEALRHAGVYA